MELFFAYFSIAAALGSGLMALLGEARPLLASLVERRHTSNPSFFGLRRGPSTGAFAQILEPDRFPGLLRIAVFAILGLCGASAIVAGLSALLGSATVDRIGLGLPWLAWHVRLDALSGFFFLLIGIGVTAVSLFGPGYVRDSDFGKNPFSVLGFFTGLFVAGMLLVLLADDAFFFVTVWEVMSVASYFLVAYHHENSSTRRAAFLYLLMAEIGALSIILAFGVLAGFGKAFTFDAMRTVNLDFGWATIAFVLALVGFGMKAGLMPIHAWLPEAHPAAPSHISALMSGVMLKVAVYGFIRFSFDILGDVQWQWGVIILVVGSASAVLGVLYALAQSDVKRLLAYSSVENIGVVFMGLGLSMIFIGDDHPHLGALGLVAALFHAFNHALFKSLLFLGAGSVLHQTHEQNLERMGGLIHRMPKTAALFLVGCLGIAALPPLNGFASEWLTFQTALQAPVLENGVLRSVIPTTAAVLALTGALAAACFAKVYGIMFLGLPRSRHVGHAREVGEPGMLRGPALLAALCLAAGIFPTALIDTLDGVVNQLLGTGLPSAGSRGWLWLTPVSPQVASYSAPMVLIGLLLAWGIGHKLLKRPSVRPPRAAEPWDCGFGGLNPRMQYTSRAFSMPLRRIFDAVWDTSEEIDKEIDPVDGIRVSAIRHRLHIGDPSWRWLYEPVGHGVMNVARRIGRIQTGNIRTYIAYSFFTLLTLLWVIS